MSSWNNSRKSTTPPAKTGLTERCLENMIPPVIGIRRRKRGAFLIALSNMARSVINGYIYVKKTDISAYTPDNIYIYRIR
jgi:hypothetical protein